MAHWQYTHIKKNEAVNKDSITSYILNEPQDSCSLARDNNEYWFKDRNESDWVLITPNGFMSSSDKYAKSCLEMSRHFDTTVIMTLGEGNCMGMVFAQFDKGKTIRVISAIDGMWGERIGEPQKWENEILGDILSEEANASELTLHKIAEVYGLSGYSNSLPDNYWDINEKIILPTKVNAKVPNEPDAEAKVSKKKPWWKLWS